MDTAWQYHRYGGVDVLAIGPLVRPRAGASEVIVRVHAAALNPKDALFRKGRFKPISGRRFPKFPGVDFAGVVVEAGPRAGLAVGARVFGALQEWRFLRGSLASYLVARHDEVAPLADGLPFAQAAALPLAGLTALQALRDLGHVGAGARVAVNGGAGGVGSLAIQIARARGAHVTAIASARNRALCLELGADEVLAYDEGDPLAGGSWDVFLDAFGNRSFPEVRSQLTPRGIYVSTVPTLRIVADRLRTALVAKRARLVVVRASRPDLLELVALWQSGKLRPLIDRVVPFGAVPEAFRHLETKRARGKIVVEVAAGEDPTPRA